MSSSSFLCAAARSALFVLLLHDAIVWLRASPHPAAHHTAGLDLSSDRVSIFEPTLPTLTLISGAVVLIYPNPKLPLLTQA